MKSAKTRKIIRIVAIIVAVMALVALIFYLSLKQLPVRVLTEYSFDTLWEEVNMHDVRMS
jgi:flagellar basal body-associated protein FliL